MQFLVTIKHQNKFKSDIKIEGKTKSDPKSFQELLNKELNGFQINMKDNEFKTFMTQYISDKTNNKNVNIYSNAGNIGDGFLFKNAFVKFGNNKPIFADEDGFIKIADNKYIKVSNEMTSLPSLLKCNKTGSEVAKEFVENIVECWNGNEILPLIALGLMLMAIHFEKFVLNEGYPILIIFGKTTGGKSTITFAGMNMQGMPRESLYSGSSTANSYEHICSKYNGINVCIDDIKEATISSNYFTDVVKTAYTGTIRAKMANFGKNVTSITLKSPIVYSSNAKSPQDPEVQNRLLVINIPKGKFNDKKYKFFENTTKSKELSLILPEILKYSEDDVLKMHKDNEKLIESNIQNVTRRIINNNAIAYTGLQLLLEVGNTTIENLEEKFLDFVKNQVKQYDDLKDVVDKVLSEIPILYQLGQLEKDVFFRFDDYKAENGNIENVVCFNKNALIAKINQCNYHDKSKYIDKDIFNAFYKEHSRYRAEKSVRYRSLDNQAGNYTASKKSVVFCIDELEDYSVFNGVKNPEDAENTEVLAENPLSFWRL